MRTWALILGILLALVAAAPAGAETTRPVGSPVRATPPWLAPWTDSAPDVLEDVRAGLPFVTLVVVPLCSSEQVDCGGQGAGDPGALEKNLYWGRAFGVRRFLAAMPKTWELVSTAPGSFPVLEEVVYRRSVSGRAWGVERSIEQLLVLRAVHGSFIDGAVDDFWQLATHGGSVSFFDGCERSVRVHVAGYAGHNRLMDGKTLRAAAAALESRPSFVLACRSAPYFSDALREAGATPLVMTRDLMAPEGYVIEAVARALGDRATTSALRERVVRAYAKWQRIPENQASLVFAR